MGARRPDEDRQRRAHSRRPADARVDRRARAGSARHPAAIGDGLHGGAAARGRRQPVAVTTASSCCRRPPRRDACFRGAGAGIPAAGGPAARHRRSGRGRAAEHRAATARAAVPDVPATAARKPTAGRRRPATPGMVQPPSSSSSTASRRRRPSSTGEPARRLQSAARGNRVGTPRPGMVVQPPVQPGPACIVVPGQQPPSPDN